MDKYSKWLDMLMKKKHSLVLGRKPDSLKTVVGKSTMNKLKVIMNNRKHPLHSLLAGQRNKGRWLLSLCCRSDQFRRSFVPTAKKLSKTLCKCDK